MMEIQRHGGNSELKTVKISNFEHKELLRNYSVGKRSESMLFANTNLNLL